MKNHKRATILAGIEAQLEGRRLLDHPFYRRWSAGELQEAELAGYAGQYRYIEASLPGWLAGIRDTSVDPDVVELVQRNLEDEVGGTNSHLELFEHFATAVGAPTGRESHTGPATSSLLATHADLVGSSPAEGLAAVLAYELQASEISATKAAGLRTWYGLDDEAVAFWDVHADLEGDHASWTLDAVVAAGGEAQPVAAAARRAADAWWAFLDEREAAARLS